MSRQTVLITGATGLIGQSIVQRILKDNKTTVDPVHIIAVNRTQGKGPWLFGPDAENIEYHTGDIRDIDLSGLEADYIIHAASETQSRAFVEKPIETASIALDGTRHMLEFAACQKHLKRFLYLSSMEVYGTPQTDEKIDEKRAKEIDSMQVRAAYPLSKLMCENLCMAYMVENDVPVNVLRLTQTFGPGVPYDDSRVFAEFARDAIEGIDIILKTKGETKRSYLYTEDAVNAVVAVLKNGTPGEAYNAANEMTYCSIYDMALLVAEKIAGSKIQVRIEENGAGSRGFAPTLHMNLDTTKLQRLGWKAEYGLEEMFRKLIEDMKKKADI